MALSNHILTIVEPSIELDKLKFKPYGEDKGQNNTSEDYGGQGYPFVSINGYAFSPEDIQNFEIRVDGFIPRISVTIIDSMGQFAVDTFPRDGDVINVRIAPKNQNVYRDIRIDFDIDSVQAPLLSSIQVGVGGGKYSFTGTMKVPGLFADVCSSYESATSKDHLLQIATELGLGMATNVDTADDIMKFLVAYETRMDAIKNRVDHSYISDNSFQTFSIDPYYYLNYVDMNSLLESEEDFEQALIENDLNLLDQVGDQENSDEKSSFNILTSHQNAEGTSSHILAYSLKNQAGKAVRVNGYKRTLQYFENDSEEGLVSFDVEALSSSQMKDIEEPLKGRRDEERYKEEVKYKYMGRLDVDPETSNTHLNYNFARIHNKQNMDELKKLTLEVELSGFNPSLHRYQKIPVAIFNQVQNQVYADKYLKEKKQEQNFETTPTPDDSSDIAEPTTLDDFLSGFYVIGDIKYKYSKKVGRMTQSLTLLRREWPSRFNNIR